MYIICRPLDYTLKKKTYSLLYACYGQRLFRYLELEKRSTEECSEM